SRTPQRIQMQAAQTKSLSGTFASLLIIGGEFQEFQGRSSRDGPLDYGRQNRVVQLTDLLSLPFLSYELLIEMFVLSLRLFVDLFTATEQQVENLSNLIKLKKVLLTLCFFAAAMSEASGQFSSIPRIPLSRVLSGSIVRTPHRSQ